MPNDPVTSALASAHKVLDNANKFRASAHAQAGDYSHPHTARKAAAAETEHAAPMLAPKPADNVGQELAEKAKNVGDYAKATQ